MDTSFLLNAVLNGVLGARGKRSHRASRYLTGGPAGFLSNPATLMTAAGLAWGAYETWQRSHAPSGDAMAGGARVPPLANAGPVPMAAVPPAPSTSPAQDAGANAAALRMVRLAISAANADGAMNERERAAILQQATAAGVSEAVVRELDQPQPLADIVAGVTTSADAATLYVLAFAILRADEQVTGAERIYLAQLAHLLGLDAAAVQALEQNAGERIDALGDQGQLGG